MTLPRPLGHGTERPVDAGAGISVDRLQLIPMAALPATGEAHQIIALEDGTVWQWVNGAWAKFGGGDGGGTYLNPAAVPQTVGGITAGTTFPIEQTMQQMFDRLLYPYQPPGFNNFYLNGQPGSVEVGYSIPVALSFIWGVSNAANVKPNSITIVDNTAGRQLGTGLPNNGSASFTNPAPIQKLTATSHSWTISGVNSLNAGFSRGYSVSWYWKLYYGVNASPTITEPQIKAMAGNLAGGYGGTYSMPATGYKYICFAHVAGGQINSIKDQLTGFNVPFANASDNPAYSNVDGGGFNYALVSVTNANGVTTQYRVYRSTNVLGGAITLVVA